RRGADNDAKRYLESLLAPSMSQRSTTSGASKSRRMTTLGAPTQAQSSAPDQSAPWQRLEIEPGLEVHIRSDYTPPTTSARTKSLVDRIRGVISRYWKEKDRKSTRLN